MSSFIGRQAAFITGFGGWYKYARCMVKSTTRVGHPARVFRYSDDDEKRMQVQSARPCVLYDDLMLEYAGAAEDAILCWCML